MTAPSSTGTGRADLLSAYIEAVAAAPRSLSRAEVLEGGGIDAELFRSHFGEEEEPLLAAWDLIAERCRPLALSAFGAEPEWRAGIRAAGSALIGYLVENPAHAHLLFVEAPTAGGAARERIERELAVYAELIDRGRAQMRDPGLLTRATADGLAGAVYSQISRHLLRGDAERLAELAPQLMFMVVRPYLGLEEATGELRR